MAAWSLKVNIVWPRFILALVVMAGLVVVAGYALESGKKKK